MEVEVLLLVGGGLFPPVIGIVGGYPVPEVNRISNAFISGAQAVNPEVEAKVSFINSWFDPASAKEAALAQIDAGADVFHGHSAHVFQGIEDKRGAYAELKQQVGLQDSQVAYVGDDVVDAEFEEVKEDNK